MIGARSNNFVCRVVAAVALLVAPMVTIERAEAHCTPATSTATPANNTTVTCSGTTQNQNTDGVSNFGYGTGNETGITIDVQSGASVTGTGIAPNTSGIFVHDGTIDNHGLVTVSAFRGMGIQAGGNITVNNSGGINFDTTGHGDHGVFNGGRGNVTVNNAATGIIFGELTGVSIAGGTLNVTNAGIIQSITASQQPNAAIQAGDTNVTNNGGLIQATGSNSTGIHATGTATVTSNTGNGTTTGIISGNAFGIDAGTVIVQFNTGKIEAAATGGIAINAANDVTVTSNTGTIQATSGTAIHAGTLNVTNARGGTINGGIFGIVGSGIVTNAGTITGGTNAVSFQPGATTNTLILQTGSVLNGAANGNLGATNNLILQGNGTVSNAFSNFNSLDVQAVGSWTWNTTTNFDTTTVTSGTFVVDSSLASVFTVKSGGTLAGQGNVAGTVTVESGGTVAPGAAVPFSTLSGGNFTFQPGSIFRVNVNAAGQNDRLLAGTANLNGGTVNVLAQNGAYAPSTKYTIVTGLNTTNGVSGTFSSVTTNLAFLTPSLSYDANDVFLTLATNGGAIGGTGFGFATVAQTRNQNAVATALDGGAASNPLVTAVLNQTADGARQAFDALSGEVFGSVQTTQAGQTQFARSAMLGRLRQASYSGAPGELGALAFGGPELAYASGDANGFPAKAPARRVAPRAI